MKKVVIITGTVFLSLTLISILFKLLSWPGANIGLTISIVGLAFVTIPVYAKHYLQINK